MAGISIFINGTAREVVSATDLAALLQQLSLAEKRVAVEMNGNVVPRAEWPETSVDEGDRLEIVHFVGGG
jgi:sulfur carrier protein